MKDERQITCRLIDYLEKRYDFDFIAREVPFAEGERRADIVAANKLSQSTYAFEIKSDNDTLARLDGQLQDYRCTFNYVYVVTTKKYLSIVKGYGLWFGVLLIDQEGRISIEREARKRNLTDNKYRRPQSNRIDGDSNLKYLHWLCDRYEPLYELFLKERTSNPTSEEDIKILSLRSDRIALL
ncbi:TPA: sce7726 family protein [Vibrio parahaemolyticus]|uniref:sce7726 family protein n=1 Tax=Vibrio parahaemolyticus TaxID=670 RepID=UPI001A219752|nr:sce7726 family protein [Vibrio parahaemolyticus]EGQ8008889.1 sce7726 family protein [Vibrio parahaemolyticus]EHK2868921.1 sce7726 family protein [Vibrio parahaemolyticus]EJG0673741.1 sce7726 family protein [Vibrio parahaemolyticus]ELA9534658.1 sce7726 family protein [Vibrio parahaemolyticus]MCC3817771.1 sce7726 family protein [Vibrio parahaemolyticus]